MKNRSLARLFKRSKLSLDEVPSKDQWSSFVKSIEALLDESDEGRRLLERALSISSREIEETLKKQKESNLDLAQASKMLSLGTMATGIAHELNNPLAGIRGHAELLQGATLGEKESYRVSRIVDLSDRMTNIVRHLLRLCHKPKSDGKSQFSVQKAISDSFSLSGNHLIYENISIQNKLPEKDIIGVGDLHGIVTVFQNLINNAYDEFTRKKSASWKNNFISVLLDKEMSDQEKIVIQVTDNAGGISEKNIARIFDPFFTTKDIGSGTGLGLSLAKKIMMESGGDLLVDSEGEETTFKVVIKRHIEKSAEDSFVSLESTGKLSNIAKLDAYKKKVLIVDDEKDVLEILAEHLEIEYDVTATTSPVSALQILEEEKFDILVTDLKMPVLSGEELLNLAREKNEDMKLVVVSGHVDAMARIEDNPNFQATVKILRKPFPKRETLLKALREMSDKKVS